MSRAPPFPTRRRSPSNGASYPSSSSYASQPLSAPGIPTRPLQIRPPSRPTTPSNSSFVSGSSLHAAPNTAPIGPSRPQRSERRGHISEYSGSERASISSQDLYRDSISTTRSELASSYRTSNVPLHSRSNQPQQSPTSDDGDHTTPTSLVSALSAFQSAGTRRRQTLNAEDVDYQREREAEMEAEKLRQQRIREKVPGIRVKRGGTKAGEIDAVLDQVKDGWEFVIDPDFNNVELALQLLDSSSHGKNMESFRNTKNMLSKALRGSVDKHYQAFAASLPHHASLLNHLGESQAHISSTRTSLTEAKDALASKRADLVQLWNRTQTLEEMLRVLDQIEHLKRVPDLLETLMSEKRLLQASVLLVKSLKIINKPDMLEVGAISDLRSYLNGQETALREILTDELQSHLYLKSFWCDARWSAYAPNQQNLPRGEVERDVEPTGQSGSHMSPTSPSFRQTRLTRFLNNLALRPNDPPLDMSDPGYFTERNDSGTPSIPPNGTSLIHSPANLNPESDSFAYMETLLESLAVLGKLGAALDNVSQRLPGEIFSLIETTLGEVEDRAEYGKKRALSSLNEGTLDRSEGIYVFTSRDVVTGLTAGAKLPLLDASTLRLSALESSSKRGDHEILRDLFWTLYSKLDAVAQGLRVVSEVANRIGSRRDYRDSSGTKPTVLFPLSEIWSPVEVEVRRLINDYLTDEQRGSALSRNPISSINEILREGRFSRDKIKPVFRFSDTDNKVTNKVLKPHEDGLIQVLKGTMPGLAPSGAGDNAQTIVTNLTDDHLLGSDQHHRLLIRPDAFHVTVLFQPTLSFLHQVSESLPSVLESARASSTVLDEFVLKVYLPQLEEKVLDLFHDAVTGPEAFQTDPLSLRLCYEPLVKASTHLMALVNSLCAMLRTSPFHRENYSRLILGVVIQFYQRCSDRFQALTTGEPEIGVERRVSLAAQWAQSSELHPCLSELMATDVSEVDRQHQLCRQETNIEFELMRRKTLVKEDLVLSIRNLAALASLYRSVSWFSSKLKALKATPEDIMVLASPDAAEPSTSFTPATHYIPASDTLQLPLSREMALRFQALLETYEQLSGLVLNTIRVDLRCRTIYHLDAAMRHGSYSSHFEATEPDSHIVDLNSELVQCDEFTSASLPMNERQFVFAGLGHLMEQILISNAHHLKLPNAFGIRKIIRNMLALQQSIKTLTNDQQHTEFERARRYYELFFLTPQEMLDGIRQRQSFSFDEYQTMLNFQCGVDPSEGEAGIANATDRKYSLYMIDLHGLEIHSPNP